MFPYLSLLLLLFLSRGTTPLPWASCLSPFQFEDLLALLFPSLSGPLFSCLLFLVLSSFLSPSCVFSLLFAPSALRGLSPGSLCPFLRCCPFQILFPFSVSQLLWLRGLFWPPPLPQVGAIRRGALLSSSAQFRPPLARTTPLPWASSLSRVAFGALLASSLPTPRGNHSKWGKKEGSWLLFLFFAPFSLLIPSG